VAITLDRYSHALPTMQTEAMARLDAVLGMNVEPSAFIDKSGAPARDALEATLGAAYRWWEALEVRLAIDHDPVLADWTYSGRRHGWALRLKHRDRPIVYLTPLAGRFRANLAIPERAMTAALEADLPELVLAIVASAPVYVEGRAVRFEVASEDDVAAVLCLARIRMAS
jgi:hypothetical protein